jgi:hypothetical protein
MRKRKPAYRARRWLASRERRARRGLSDIQSIYKMDRATFDILWNDGAITVIGTNVIYL